MVIGDVRLVEKTKEPAGREALHGRPSCACNTLPDNDSVGSDYAGLTSHGRTPGQIARSGARDRGRNAVLYPIFLDLSGRRCVVVGGGGVASRKARKLLQARAEVVVISPEVGPELEGVAVEVRPRPYEDGDLGGGVPRVRGHGLRARSTRLSRGRRGSVTSPSTSRTGPRRAISPCPRRCGGVGLQVAVSTGGASPDAGAEDQGRAGRGVRARVGWDRREARARPGGEARRRRAARGGGESVLVAVAGMSHRSAPVEVRERVAFPPCAARASCGG